ncbi:hypothetical protein PIB30_010439 [Stylosanthes scabra]|uniref:Uncharacterized protein n=1 Tax=Stylosanthes scabra TaxID=79078 RepID=A0ABU6Y4A4_9FABA|nr:hypothetical protein [Stylosanthes scabra]
MAMNRETDENRKPLVVVGENYSWVKGEVRDLSSLFLDAKSVEQIGDPSTWIREGSGIKLRFLPCREEDRVYQSGEGWEFFFMYTTVFLDVEKPLEPSEEKLASKSTSNRGAKIEGEKHRSEMKREESERTKRRTIICAICTVPIHQLSIKNSIFLTSPRSPHHEKIHDMELVAVFCD